MGPEVLFTLRDIDGSSGQVKSSFVFSRATQDASKFDYRIDNVSEVTTQHTEINGTNARLQRQYFRHIIEYLRALFLPIGYPYSVTEDYTTYQIFDSIQAFASSIAGLLSSRAVLQSLDVISSSSSDGTDSIVAASASAATAATLLSVLQTTLANVTSILFASRAAPRISSEVKYYRFLADVVNDAAFVLDLLAPALPSKKTTLPLLSSLLPISPRVVVLCTSSIMRSICGVSAGSSKAVLSTHFARNNPESVGDLNAKDGSQETVVGLAGMWVGGIVVSRVESVTATWCWMIALLCLHLWANYQAVRSVTLKTLNRERASMVCSALCAAQEPFQNASQTRIDFVRSQETILGIVPLYRSLLVRLRGVKDRSQAWKRWELGIPLQEFLRKLDFRSADWMGVSKEMYIGRLMDVFKYEAYLLHWNSESHQALVMLKEDARPVDQLKAWLHATYIQHKATREPKLDAMSILTQTLAEMHLHWEKCCSMLEESGWDLSTTNLESLPSHRLRIT